jgi:pyrroloquinoline quinone biosynthesis protein E
MSTGDVVRVIEEFHKLGAVRLGLSGGEPLLRDDLGEITARAAEMNYVVSVNTNGWFLEEKFEAVRQADVIVFSLDGPPDVHDRSRGAGACERLFAGLDRAQRAGKRLAAIVVVTALNLDRLRETLQSVARFGARAYLQPVTACDISGELPANLRPEPSAFRREIQAIVADRRRLPLASSPAFLKHLLRYPDFSNGINCLAGRDFVYVTPDGHLTPCHVSFLSHEQPSILAIGGVAQGLRSLRRRACSGCAISPYVEQNLLAMHDAGSMWHAAKTFLG